MTVITSAITVSGSTKSISSTAFRGIKLKKINIFQTETFKRRTPEESDISELTEIEKVYDYIRMLDAPGYPNAYIETPYFRIEFTGAELRDGEVTATVRIKAK